MRKSRSMMKEETRAKLIEAGRKAFATKGYNQASMDDFTANVGLTRGALYHHFGDKKGLFRAVIHQIDEEIDACILAQIKDCNDIWHIFMTESRVYLESMLDPEIQKIVMCDGPSVLGDINYWPSQAHYHELLAEHLTTMMQQKMIRVCDPFALARLINSTLYAAAYWVANDDQPEKTLQKAWQAFALLMDGLRLEGN